ncbi:MAG: PHP domain-containing protein [Planctomycetes bacterium]|nr:PHP domain-containing protein [Planctomycetota bacterium]
MTQPKSRERAGRVARASSSRYPHEAIDLHIHTHFSECTHKPTKPPMTVENIVRKAEESGYETIGLCDHIHKGSDTSIVERLREEVGKLKPNIRVLVGCEADVISPSEVSVRADFASRVDFIALAATHYQMPWVQIPLSTDPSEVANHYVEMFAKAVNTDFVDIIAHPFCTHDAILGNMPVILAKILDDDLIELLEIAKTNRIAMELTPKVFNPLNDGCLIRFYKLCKQVGVKISLGSDSHTVNGIGRLSLVLDRAARIGLDPSDFLLPHALSHP